MTLSCLHPAIQASILHYAKPEMSLADIARELGVSKQAVSKRINKSRDFLMSYGKPQIFLQQQNLDRANRETAQLKSLVSQLRLQLVLHGAVIFILSCFKEAVQRVFPNFKVTRLSAFQKKRLLDYWSKFEALGGTLKDYCAAIERSPETLRKWIMAYEMYGMAGLQDKKSRPRRLGNKIPVWLRDQLFILFIKFPQWTPYQYYKYITANPATYYPISIPTITKLKATHAEKSATEKDRIKKRWAFTAGTRVWTVDFTCLHKHENYKLQLLTVSDAGSRFFFETALYLETSTAHVIDHLEELFIKYGKPAIIKADNGPEFRLECRNDLAKFCVYLLNSPIYYGQFCASHERIHRTLKGYVESFEIHHNLTRLEADIRRFRDDYNHLWTLEILNDKTPAEVFYSTDMHQL